MHVLVSVILNYLVVTLKSGLKILNFLLYNTFIILLGAMTWPAYADAITGHNLFSLNLPNECVHASTLLACSKLETKRYSGFRWTGRIGEACVYTLAGRQSGVLRADPCKAVTKHWSDLKTEMQHNNYVLDMPDLVSFIKGIGSRYKALIVTILG